MKNENIVNFDLSVLSLDELITLYETIASFTRYLKDQKIEEKNEANKDG